jgi:hypothetical protein
MKACLDVEVIATSWAVPMSSICRNYGRPRSANTCGSLRQPTSFAKVERPPSCRPTLVAGTGGERLQIGTINSDDGKQAARSPDPLSSLDPNRVSVGRD